MATVMSFVHWGGSKPLKVRNLSGISPGFCLRLGRMVLSISRKALPLIGGVGLGTSAIPTHLGRTAHGPSCFDCLVRSYCLLHSPSHLLRTVIWFSKCSFVVSRHSMV